MERVKERLSQLYYTVEEPSSFGSARSLKKKTRGVTRLNVDKWLRQQTAYTLHKPARKNYKRNRTVVNGIDDQWQADLVDMREYAGYNYDYKYILTVIDIFTKYAWVVPLKKKTGDELCSAFKKIFAKGRYPIKLNTDQGKEFDNKKVKTLLHNRGIMFFTTRSDKKAAVVERFNRTLKNKMWRYFTFKNTHKYIDVLADLVRSYNGSIHRSIGVAPSDVDYSNEADVYLKLYGLPGIQKKINYKFKVGDTVRISKYKAVFEKGYLPNWTEEIFIISERIPRTPPVYRIKDCEANTLEGTFYEYELQKVDKSDDVYIVEKILKRENRRRTPYVLVKWRGYPASMNSWLPASDLITL